MSEFHKDKQLQQEGKLEEAIAAYEQALELNSNDSWTHHHMGEALSKLGRFDEAVTAYRHAIEFKPDFSWSYHHLGDVLAQQEQWEESAIAFGKAIKLNPEHFGTYVGLGNSLAKVGKLDEAIVAYRRATELNPDADWIYNTLANAVRQRTQSDLAEAIASYRQIIELNPNNVKAYQNLLEVQPDNWEVCLQLGNTLVEQGKLDEAIVVYRRLVALSPMEKYYQQLGELLGKLSHWDEAIATYRRILELNPEAYECHYQLGEAIYQRVIKNPETFFYNYNLAELPHKKYQIFDPNLPEVCLINDERFLQATAHLDDETYAVELYRVYLRRSLSEAEKQGCIDWLQIPGHSRVLGLNAWRTKAFPEFHQLLESSIISVCLEQATACYRRAIKLCPSHYQSYYRLANILIEQGNPQAALSVYHQLSLSLAEVGRLHEAVACLQKVPQIIPINRQEIYESLWKGFNQLGTIDRQYSYYPSDLQSSEIEQYFVYKSKYTVMNIWNLSEGERAFLEKNNIYLANIELIAQDKIALEEIYINSFVEDNQSRELTKKYPKTEYSKFVSHQHLNQINAYQQSIAETGYIYSICPVTGKIIRSNQSFYDVGWLPIISYRFVGYETYYLTVGHFWGPKLFIYFPRLELIIHLSHPHAEWQAKDVINRLKANMVSCWKETLNYISTPTKKVAAILGTIPNIGHYFWNEVTGIYYLYENEILSKLDLILIEPHEYFNLGGIFPEVVDKIRRITDKRSVFKTIIGENYCALRATNVLVKESLAVRVYDGSAKRCSQSVLEEVEQARKKHFPLLWFGIRTHNKSWVSQVEGIVNIVKSLAADFPNLGVVIDGWSRTEIEDAYGESMIAKDQATLNKILDIIPSSIGIYSTIGSMMYEKVVWAYAIDLYVIPLGSGSTVVSWIANKPGVMHANSMINQGFREQVTNGRENSVPPVFIAVEDIVDIIDPEISPYNLSYDIDWKVIYNEVTGIISHLKNIH